MDRESTDPAKKPRLASSGAGLEGLFNAIDPPASGRAASSHAVPERAGGRLMGGLLALGANMDRVMKMMDIFAPAFDIRQVGVVSALQYKDNDRAPRAPSLTDSEYLALRYYMGPAYYERINRHLRGGRQCAAMDRVVGLIKDALIKLESPATCISFRAVRRHFAPPTGAFVEPALLSASQVMSRADKFMSVVYGVGDGPEKSMIVIFGLDARRVCSAIDEGPHGLKEVIYPPGTRFNVIFRGISHKRSGTEMLVMTQDGRSPSGHVERQIEALALASFGCMSI